MLQRTIWSVVFLVAVAVGQTDSSRAAPEHVGVLADEKLVGLWGVEQMYGPLVRGELTIDGRSDEWRAHIAGCDAVVQHHGQEVSFILTGDRGEFRGRLSADKKQIAGQWIQAPGATLHQRYASPVRLRELAPDVWRGTVAPLDDRITFFLMIDRTTGGKVTAYIRNPEHNWFGRGAYEVSTTGNTIALTRGEQRLEGSYEVESDSLLLGLVDGAPPLKLVRRKRDDALGFLPRLTGSTYHYQQPINENDGWAAASLAEVGLSPQPVVQLIEKILAANPADNSLNVQSLLIARHGKLVLEEYFYGFSKNRSHDMRSASKTFAPMLVGIARDKGAKINPGDRVLSLFPQYQNIANIDDRKRQITLGNLMNMASGLCDDSDPKDNEDTMQEQTEQPDWYKYALDLPMRKDPGGRDAAYCSSNLNLVGGAVRHVTGRDLPDFFDEFVAQPLQFRGFYMNLMPTGEGYMGGGLYLTPRDQLKIGQIYLAGGIWNGKQILSRQWVNESLQERTSFVSMGDFDPPVHGYGYGWHTRALKAGERTYRDYYMGGNGGQIIIILPELDMVVVFNGGNYGEANKFFRWEAELLPQYIIPAVTTQ
jgi:CubicO group peptidase (beta-lactamase class C family)